MAKHRVYHFPACSTCKRALKWLTEHHVAFEPIHIVDHPPTQAELRQASKSAGIPVRKLFNTSGASYREGGFSERLKTMSEAEAFNALASDGKLIKRPLLLGSGIALVGFDEQAYRRALE